MNPIKLLIVEDDPIIATDLERAMTKMGYQVVDLLESGEEALELIERDAPDLVLMDIHLEGDLDGIDTAHLISKKKSIPIIYLTSNTDQSTFNRAKLTQPHSFLSKPFRLTDIKHSIDLAFLDHQKADEVPKLDRRASLPYSLNNSIFVKSRDHLVKITLEEIQYIEADSCYCTIHTRNEEHLIVSTLKKFSNSVKLDALLRIHRSFIVNIHKIEKIGDSYVMIGDRSIPIGRSYREELFGKIKRY